MRFSCPFSWMRKKKTLPIANRRVFFVENTLVLKVFFVENALASLDRHSVNIKKKAGPSAMTIVAEGPAFL